MGLAPPYGLAAHCIDHCSACVAQDIRAMRTRRHPHLPPRFTEAVSRDTYNTGQGLRSFRDLTLHLTTRADDGHAAPV